MAQTRWNFGTGSNGDTLTAANTGTSAAAVFTAGTGTISTAQAIIGTRSALMTATSGSGACYFQKGSLSTTALNVDLYVYLTAAPSAAVPVAWFGTGSRMVSLEINAARTVTIKDSPFAAAWTSSYAIPLNTWVRLALYAVQSATVGQLRAAIYSSASDFTTVEADSTLLTGKNTGASAYTDLRIGAKTATGTQTTTLHIGSWSYDPAAAGLPASYVSSVNYTANPADNAGATDAAAVVQDLVESIADGASVTDTGAPQSIDYGPSTDDPGAASDSATFALDLARTAADSASGTDLATKSAGLSRTAADPSGITDSVTALLLWMLTPADPAGGADQVSLAATVARGPADPAGGTDALAVVAVVSRAGADSGGGTDLVSATLARAQASGDAAGGTDQVTFVLTIQRTLTDAAGVADARTIVIELPVPASTPAYRIVRTRTAHRTVQGGGNRTVHAMKRRQ